MVIPIGTENMLATYNNHIISTINDSDSDSDSYPRISLTMSVPANNSSNVSVIQNSLCDTPIMSASTLSYDTILEFERAAKHFFNAKNIAPASQVSQILYNFNDSLILTWVESSPNLPFLSFSDFMGHFKTTWLSLKWEDDIVFHIIDFQGYHDFNTWVSNVQLANSLLAEHPLHAPNTSLHAHIIAQMSTKLRHEYCCSDHDNSLASIVKFNAWLHQVQSIDERVCSCSRE